MSKRITNVKKGPSTKSVLGAIAAVLAILLVAGVVVVYNVIDSGFIQRHQVAMKSDNYEVTSAMMNYYFNTLYQNYAESYKSMGLDTTKPLDEQNYIDGKQTWHDFFMAQTKDQVRQLLVTCEAAKAAGYTLEKDDSHDHSADETLKSMATVAATYGANLKYYLENVYGEGVNEKVFRDCYELSEIASHYTEEMTGSYEFTSEDWDKYYSENKDTYNMVDYLSYTFKVTETKVDKDATEDEKAAAKALDQEEAKRLEGLAGELLLVTTPDAFKTYVESYLRTDLYKDKTEEELKKEKIDIEELVEDCITTGAKNSSQSDLNKWLFDSKRAAHETYLTKTEDGLSFTVYMILPAADTADLGLACIYRDTYPLKNIRYIPFATSTYNDNAETAKGAAEDALEDFKNDPTEDAFAALADEYNEGANGGLVENLNKGSLGDAGDAWLYDSARKAGDCEIIEVEDQGYYLVYYIGDGDIKWQSDANNALVQNAYNEDYAKLEEKYVVKTVSKGLDLVEGVVAATEASNG